MNKGIIASVISFLLGGGVGLLISNKIYSKKYKALADKEIESVKKSLELYYNNKGTITKEKENSASKVEAKKHQFLDKDSIDMDKLKNRTNGDNPYHNAYGEIIKEEKYSETIPYVIPPEEFADSDFSMETLHYYSDGILADDEMNEIKNVKETIGDDALKSFGKYEGDVVYVRDEINRIDYEILLEEGSFASIRPKERVGVFPGDDE